MSVAGKFDLRTIYQSLNGLSQLEDLRFLIHTTYSVITYLSPSLEWPRTLKRLYLVGMIDFSHYLYNDGFPSTLTHLTIGSVPESA